MMVGDVGAGAPAVATHLICELSRRRWRRESQEP